MTLTTNYKTMGNPATGNKFIVFAEGLGISVGIRCWAESHGGYGGQKDEPATSLNFRFRAEVGDSDLDSEGLKNLFAAVKWTSASPKHLSAIGRVTAKGIINGSTLTGLLKSQNVLGVIYSAWKTVIDEKQGFKMLLNEDEFFTAIITTMEGEIDENSDLNVNLPFTKGVIDIAFGAANEKAVAAAAATNKYVGLN